MRIGEAKVKVEAKATCEFEGAAAAADDLCAHTQVFRRLELVFIQRKNAAAAAADDD